MFLQSSNQHKFCFSSIILLWIFLGLIEKKKKALFFLLWTQWLRKTKTSYELFWGKQKLVMSFFLQKVGWFSLWTLSRKKKLFILVFGGNKNLLWTLLRKKKFVINFFISESGLDPLSFCFVKKFLSQGSKICKTSILLI